MVTGYPNSGVSWTVTEEEEEPRLLPPRLAIMLLGASCFTSVGVVSFAVVLSVVENSAFSGTLVPVSSVFGASMTTGLTSTASVVLLTSSPVQPDSITATSIRQMTNPFVILPYFISSFSFLLYVNTYAHVFSSLVCIHKLDVYLCYHASQRAFHDGLKAIDTLPYWSFVTVESTSYNLLMVSGVNTSSVLPSLMTIPSFSAYILSQ